jgi:hypothetical protein
VSSVVAFTATQRRAASIGIEPSLARHNTLGGCGLLRFSPDPCLFIYPQSPYRTRSLPAAEFRKNPLFEVLYRRRPARLYAIKVVLSSFLLFH